MENEIELTGKPTLCWFCQNTNRYKCTWFNPRNPQPVPGWTAEKTQNGGYESYRVISCPNYLEMPNLRGRKDEPEQVSRHTGVYFYLGKWGAFANEKGRRIYIGRYATEEEAAEARARYMEEREKNV